MEYGALCSAAGGLTLLLQHSQHCQHQLSIHNCNIKLICKQAAHFAAVSHKHSSASISTGRIAYDLV